MTAVDLLADATRETFERIEAAMAPEETQHLLELVVAELRSPAGPGRKARSLRPERHLVTVK